MNRHEIDQTNKLALPAGYRVCARCDGRGRVCVVCERPAPPGHWHARRDAPRVQVVRCPDCAGAGLVRTA